MGADYMTILIERKCVKCENSPCRFKGAVIGTKEVKSKPQKKSYNIYWCPRCHENFLVERIPSEQNLVEKYIASGKIKLT